MSERIEEERLLQSIEGFLKLIATADATTFISASRKIRYCDILRGMRKRIMSLYARVEALEAAQTARVLTLEKVKGIEVVYLEDFSDPDDGVEPIIRPAVNIEAKNGGIVMLDSATWDEGFIFVVDSEYGKKWRCWTQRPTDEQREAVKWDA